MVVYAIWAAGNPTHAGGGSESRPCARNGAPRRPHQLGESAAQRDAGWTRADARPGPAPRRSAKVLSLDSRRRNQGQRIGFVTDRGRSYALGSCDVNRAKGLLRIAEALGQVEHR